MGQTEARRCQTVHCNNDSIGVVCSDGQDWRPWRDPLAGYALIGVPVEYLIAACFMSAPGGLLFAKILMPETETPLMELPEVDDSDAPVNVIDAAANGASSGLSLALNVGAMLLAFVALIAVVNGGLGGVGGWFGMPQLTLELLLGWLFSPLAFLLGVPWAEAVTAGSFIGQGVVVNSLWPI